MEITNHRIKEILEKYELIWSLCYIMGISNRDMETYMPEGAAGLRSEAHSQISTHLQQLMLDRDFVKLVGSLEGEVLNDVEKGIYRLLKRSIDEYKKLPESFIKERSESVDHATMAWRNARKNNDFNSFEPHLTKIIDLCLQKAELIGYKDHPYDVMIDHYEEGLTTKQVEEYFETLKSPLQRILANVKENFLKSNGIEVCKHDEEALKKFNNEILDYLGFDRMHQRLDISTHPFSTGLTPQDTRITTRLEKEFYNTLFSTIHEFGHSLYERGSGPLLYKTPVVGGSSLIIHESQSRFRENNVARWVAFTEKFVKGYQSLGNDFSAYSATDFYNSVNHVMPGLIRVDADELTYHFHVMIRFEIEKALMERRVTVKELPAYWNKLYKDYLGIDVPNDAVGVLQDVHWSSGLFGYFPTYSMGTALSAIRKEAMEKDIGSIEELIISPEGTAKIREWLHEKIHQYGSVYTLNDLLAKHNLQFSATPLLNYLEKKFC